MQKFKSSNQEQHLPLIHVLTFLSSSIRKYSFTQSDSALIRIPDENALELRSNHMRFYFKFKPLEKSTSLRGANGSTKIDYTFSNYG